MKIRWTFIGIALAIIFLAGVTIQVQRKAIPADRGSICALELSPFIHLTPNQAITDKITLTTLVDEAYIAKKGYTVNYPPGEQWTRSDDQHRSVNFDYHAWAIIAPLLTTLDEPDLTDRLSSRINNLIISTVQEWFAQFATFERYTADSHFAWYDMAVGLRANMLPHILKMGACSEKVNDEEFAAWWTIAIWHAEVLARDSFHVEHNNHGLYQALGHYVLCNSLDMIDRCSDDMALARSRVNEYLDSFFSKSGIHLEHSPGYQLHMLEVFNQFLTHPDLSKIITPALTQRVAETLDYFILPDGKLAQLGDTDIKQVKRKKSRPEQPEMRLFFEAGYGVVQHTDAHLIASAAFHSQTHKHADDGTFVWYDRGTPLIVDSGRYGYGRIKQTDNQRKALSEKGYWYSDPKRIYVESTHAHSTVESDGESDNRAQAEFYGSGLKQGIARDDGTFYLQLEMPRASGTVTQRRAFLYQTGEWLLVIDEMVSDDDYPHDYTSWLQLDTDAKLLAESVGSASFKIGNETLTITSLSPNTTIRLAKGETEPRLAGWRSPRGGVLLPAWSVGIDALRANNVLIAYLLSLNGPPKPIGTGKSIIMPMPDGTIRFEWLNDGLPVFVRLCTDWAANPGQCEQG